MHTSRNKNWLCGAATPPGRIVERSRSHLSVRPSARLSVSQQGSSACLAVTTATAQLQPPAVRWPQTRKKDKPNKQKNNIRLGEGESRGEQNVPLLRGKSSRGRRRRTERFDMSLALHACSAFFFPPSGYAKLNALLTTSGREISQTYS